MGILRLVIVKYLRNRRIIKQIAVFLKGGRYRNSVAYDCIYNNNAPSVLDGISFSAKESNQFVSNKLVSGINRFFLYSVSDKDTKFFKGTEVLISSSLTEYKIFDFENNLVLTLYQSIDRMKQINNNKSLYKNCFNVPQTIVFNPELSYIIEELVPHVPYSIVEAIESIGDSICKSLAYQKDCIYSDKKLFKKQCTFFSSRFGNSNLLNNKTGSIISLTHGDLWSSNVIFNGEKYFVIDFERVGQRYFLFDFFTFIFTEWLLNENSLLVDKFFSGQFDNLLKKMFTSIRMDYYAAQKEEYFISFLVVIAFERWRHFKGVDDRINQFIDIYIPSYRHNV